MKRFFTQGKLSKSVICTQFEKEFILKHLVPASLEVTETPDGFSVNGPSLEVEKCEYSEKLCTVQLCIFDQNYQCRYISMQNRSLRLQFVKDTEIMIQLILFVVRYN